MNNELSDLVFLREAVVDLREYILSPDLYRLLRAASVGPNLPQLTIGNLLLSQARLKAMDLDSPRRVEIDSISRKIEQVRSEWLANWRVKAGREFDSRLHLWLQYLQELRAEKQQQAHIYTNEVRLRVVLALLQVDGQANIAPQAAEQLGSLDQVLRGITRPGPFVWEPEISGGFPAEKFWFLYVSCTPPRPFNEV